MDQESIQAVILLVLFGLVGLSVALWVLRQVWSIVNTPVAIAILLGIIAIFLHFTTLKM